MEKQDGCCRDPRVSLAGIVRKSVGFENGTAQIHLSPIYHWSVSLMPDSSGVRHSKPTSVERRDESQTQPAARSSANFCRFSRAGLPFIFERSSPKRQTGQSSAAGMGKGT